MKPILAALCLALTCAPLAAAREALQLRHAPLTRDDAVRVSDLFDGVVEGRDPVLARAPAPGRAASYEPAWLARALSAHGYVWPGAADVARVTVRRTSQPVPAADLAAAIADALAVQEGGDWIVALSGGETVHAPEDAWIALEVLGVTREPASGRFEAEVALAAELDPIRVRGRAETSVTLPVLARALARGAVIAPDDIDWTAVPSRRAPAGALTHADELIGLAAKRALRPGRPLLARDLARPPAIERGETVLLVFEQGRLKLTVRARALADVAEGERARFSNLQSGRVIEAVAIGPGQARIDTGAYGGAS